MSAIPQSFNGEPLRHAWPYRSPVGDVLGIVARYQNGAAHKSVVPYFKQNGAGWAAGASADPRPLFGLEFIHADQERRAVVVCEGEKCAAALQSLGLCAVTSQGGSKAAHKTDWGPLSGFASAFLLPDDDAPGMGYARAVFHALMALEAPPACSIVSLPGLPEKGDVADWLAERCPSWDGFQPVPESERDRLLGEFRRAVKAHAGPVPGDWTQAAPDGWADPIPLDGEPLPPWPAGVIPEVGEFLAALSVATETPPDVAALLGLATIAAAAHGKFKVQIRDGYREPVNIWTCPALPPGSRKSAVKQAVTAPLVGWEREQSRAMAVEIATAASHHKTLSDRINKTRNKAAGLSGPAFDDAMKEIARMEAALPVIPVPPRVWTDDCTPERLGSLMCEHGERMAILSDESGLFEMMAGRYSTAPNLDIYLQGHAGSPVRVDRGSRPPVDLYAPCLTIGISPQPEALRGLAEKSTFRGRGLLARFLYALPEPNLGKRTGRAPPVPGYLAAGWDGRLRAILNIPYAADAHGDPCPHMLALTPESLAVWESFWLKVEGDMGPGGRFESATDWAGKLPGAVARIAALLHIARHALRSPQGHAISETDMLAAVRIGGYLSAHALAAFGMMGASPLLEDARVVLGWIRAEELAAFTFRDCHHRHQARFRLAEELTPVLDVLTERHYIRMVTPPGSAGRGRPSKVYEVNPAAGCFL